jgi:hypothetical protein
MSNFLTLTTKSEAFIALLADEIETFLDSNFQFVGVRTPPPKGFGAAMIEIVQGTAIDITVQLIRPNGLNFDLTGVTSIQMGIFQKTPLRQLISATAGFPTGALTDGRVLFLIPDTATNYIGFASGIVTGVKAGKPFAFEGFQVKYSENPFLPLP